MKSFLKSFLAVVLGNLVVGGILMVGAFFFFIVLLIGLGSKPTVRTPHNAFLVLDLNMTISDTPEQHGGGLGKLLAGATPKMGIWELTNALDAAGTDKKVAGLFITGSLQTENYGSGYAVLAELRRAIEDFKKTGKPVVAYLEDPSLRNYYVATTADTLYIHPYAEVGMHGLASESFYLGNALRKYGIGVQTTKVGKYKSAIEPFIGDKMSEADREQSQSLLNTLWDEIVSDVATSRKTTPAQLRRLADTHGFLDAATARSEQLVDELAYLDEVIESLKGMGAEAADHTGFAQINIRDYAERLGKVRHSGRSEVALVYAEGDIVDGWGDAESVGGLALAAQLRQIRQDGNVAAVVLRVNSPGGSAFASEVIQREVRLLSATGKPVVVSMGSLAASGGYWISAYADTIFAEKTTITGSIGVFGLMFNMQDIAHNLGVTFDGVKTAKYADMETVSRPKTADELALLQRFTDKIYDAFLDKVSEGRKLERSVVEKIAEGRVWSGVAARKLGLVDSFGGLREAVKNAACRAKLGSNYVVRQYPERRTAWEAFSESLQQPEGEPPIVRLSRAERGPAAEVSQQMSRVWRTLEKMNDRHGVYARLPYLDEVK